MPDVDLLPFFYGVYGGEEMPADQERYMCIAFLRQGGAMVERFFRWPTEVHRAIEIIARVNQANMVSGPGTDVYYCVSLTSGRKRNRDFLDQTHCVWADLDQTAPNKLALDPTFLIETSPHRYQAIWTLDESVPYSTAEDFAQRVYHAHKADGADATWDATRLLRVPGTANLKYEVAGQGNPLVALIDSKAIVYNLDELDTAYPISVSTGPGASQSEILNYQQVELVGSATEILDRYSRELDQTLLDLFFDLPNPDDDWSKLLWSLEMGLFEANLDIYEVFVVAQGAGCNKYARDGRPDADLWKDVVRARESCERKAGMVLTTTEIEEIDLLTPDEIISVTEQPDSFIERYTAWAATRTDAPVPFHLGGALMALSAGLSDKLSVPTQFGDVRPNLWVLLMADSTISRKTTSMRLSTEIYEGAGIDALLATDGSIEGIITELSTREGIPSMFLRDEFTSLVASAKKKDYMAGFTTDLCGLYDGGRVKRRLRKETIQAKDPIFLLFGGGVETKMLELLTHEDITSGFIPRFLPIFGTTSVSELNLIGPRRKRSHAAKDDLIEELRAVIERYTTPRSVLRVAGQESLGSPPAIDVDLSDAAWSRLQLAQRYLLDVADGHDSRDLLLPCTERLIVNVLKVASLIAASRQRPVADGVMNIEYDDLMMSLYYARGWLDHLLRIVARVGRDPFDAKTHQVVEFVTRMGEGGASRSAIMRNFRLSSRDTDEILGTLTDREEIVAHAPGRGAIYHATQHARTAKQIRVTAPMKVRRTNPATRR